MVNKDYQIVKKASYTRWALAGINKGVYSKSKGRGGAGEVEDRAKEPKKSAGSEGEGEEVFL